MASFSVGVARSHAGIRTSPGSAVAQAGRPRVGGWSQGGSRGSGWIRTGRRWDPCIQWGAIEPELAAARRKLKVAEDAFFTGLVTPANAAHWNGMMSDALARISELEAEQAALGALQAGSDLSAEAMVDRLRYWGTVLERTETDDARRAFLQAHISQVVIEADGTLQLRLVMTNEGCWLPRLDSNQDKQDQNLLCYRYTTGHQADRRQARRGRAAAVLYYKHPRSASNLRPKAVRAEPRG